MTRFIRVSLWGAGVVFGLLLILAVGLSLFFDLNQYKSQIESGVAKATGMQLKINGEASLHLFPQLGIVTKDVHLSNRGTELLVAHEVRVSPKIGPFLFHRELVVSKMSVVNPRVRIEKNPQGRMNFETEKLRFGSAKGKKPDRWQIDSLAIRNGDFTYLDRGAKRKVQINGVDGNLSEIVHDTGSKRGTDFMESLTFHGSFQALSFQADTLVASNLRSDFRNNRGLLDFNPTEARVFGGTVRGSALIDLRGRIPKLELHQVASHVDLRQVPKNGRSVSSGVADGSISLTASGKTAQEIAKTAKGSVSVRSQNIQLAGVDIDAAAAKLKMAQGLDLLELGSLIFPGTTEPGTGQAAGIAGGEAEKRSLVRNLVSNWSLAGGVARAKDVAFSTSKNTIAFKGDIDLVRKTYQNFYIATVDPEGCSKNKVEIKGRLNKPHPSAGSVGEQISKSYLGKAGEAVGSQIAGIFGSKDKDKPETDSSAKEASSDCDHFYSGAVLQNG